MLYKYNRICDGVVELIYIMVCVRVGEFNFYW